MTPYIVLKSLHTRSLPTKWYSSLESADLWRDLSRTVATSKSNGAWTTKKMLLRTSSTSSLKIRMVQRNRPIPVTRGYIKTRKITEQVDVTKNKERRGGSTLSKFFRSRRNIDDVLDEIGRKEGEGGEEGRGDSKIKGFPFGNDFEGWHVTHSPLSSARNSCWSCSLVGSEFDLVPVCFVEDSVSFMLFLAWWPRKAACILVAASSLSFSASFPSSFASCCLPLSLEFFEPASCDFFCEASCDSTSVGLLSAFGISENSSAIVQKIVSIPCCPPVH